MHKKTPVVLTTEDKDILQEVMNIAFGQASADLAELIDIYVVLNIPDIKVVPASELHSFIEGDVKDYTSIDLLKQHFWGKFKGVSFLIFSSGAGKKLISLLSQNISDDDFESNQLADLEKETLIEIGNILIGACIGKLAELLGDIVTYSPPVAIIENSPLNSIPKDLFEPDSYAISLKTVFRFEKEDVDGFLFIVTSDESIRWLKKALNDFMGICE